MLGKIEGRRRRGNQRMRQLDDTNNVIDMMVRDIEAWVCCSPWDSKESDTAERLNNMCASERYENSITKAGMWKGRRTTAGARFEH